MFSINCKNITAIDLSQCHKITGRYFFKGSVLSSKMLGTIKCCKNSSDFPLSVLKGYWLVFKGFISDGALGFLGQNCSSLRKGRFYSCPNVSDKGILSLAQGCHKLDEIDLSWCNRVSDQGTDKNIYKIYILRAL